MGQEETWPVQLAFAPDSRKGATEILEDRKSVEIVFFSVMCNSSLAPVPFSHTNLFGFFCFCCCGMSGQMVTQKLFPVPKSIILELYSVMKKKTIK